MLIHYVNFGDIIKYGNLAPHSVLYCNTSYHLNTEGFRFRVSLALERMVSDMLATPELSLFDPQ